MAVGVGEEEKKKIWWEREENLMGNLDFIGRYERRKVSLGVQ